MSACNVYRLGDRAVIHVDGASYDANGVLLRPSTKVWTFPAQSMAITVRGLAGLGAHIASTLAAPFADILDARKGVDYYRVMVPELVRFGNMMHPGLGSFQALFAGVAGGEAHSFAVSTDVDGFLVPEIDALTISPGPTVPFDLPPSMDDFDPDVHGLAWLEAQRRSKFELAGPGSAVAHGVGVFALATEITSEGITQKIIKRWDDQMGHPIRIPAND